MILTAPARFDENTNLLIRASIELPSTVVQVFVSGEKAPKAEIGVIAPDVTLDVLGRLRSEDCHSSMRWWMPPDGRNLWPAINERVEELRQRIRANHIIPWAPGMGYAFVNTDRCLCGEFYAPIDGPCPACLVVQDHALENGLLEEKPSNAPKDRRSAYLRWTDSAVRGGQIQPGDSGRFDWQLPPGDYVLNDLRSITRHGARRNGSQHAP